MERIYSIEIFIKRYVVVFFKKYNPVGKIAEKAFLTIRHCNLSAELTRIN